MKKLLYITVFIGVIIAMVGCAYETPAYAPVAEDFPIDYDLHITEASTVEPYNTPINNRTFEGFRLYIPADSVTPTSARLSMINDSGSYINHGAMFRLERYENGKWERLPYINDVFWHLVGFIISPHVTIDNNVDWAWMYGELPPGTYRLVQNFGLGWGADPSAGRDFTAIFHITDEWQDTHDSWLAEQDALANIAFGRFADLDITITSHSRHGLNFTLTNNNPHYAYFINTIFIGFEDRFPDGGHSAGLVYSIFREWEAGAPKHLAYGESLIMTVNWYEEIGCIMNTHRWEPVNPYQWQLVLDILLDVDEEYINQHFRHAIPNAPGQGHRIYAEFEITQE